MNSRDNTSGLSKQYNWNLLSLYRDELFGISIISIMILHYCKDVLGETDVPKLLYYFAYGWEKIIGSIGVDVFLFLSGIGLYYSMTKNCGISEFYSRRFKRVLEPYLIFGLFFWVFYDFIYYPQSIGRFLLDYSLLAFWFVENHHFWYLSVCIPMYLIFPLIFQIVKEQDLLMRRKKEVILLILSLLSVFFISLLFPQWYSMTEIGLCRFFAFLLGCFVARLVYEKKQLKNIWALVLSGIVLRLIVLLLKQGGKNILWLSINLPFNRWILTLFALSLMLLCVVVLDSFQLEKVKKILKWIGNYSLELYITHISIRIFLHYLGLKTYLPHIHLIGVIVPSFIMSVLLRRVTSILFHHK